MRKILVVALSSALLCSMALAALPTLELHQAVSDAMAPEAMTPEIVFPMSLVETGKVQAVSSCVEPSPCQTNADCDYPFGFCIPDIRDQVPGDKVCVCL